MNAVILGGSSVYSKENVRNCILQAAGKGKAILKRCLEWLMLLSCTNELLFLHLCTKKPILICLWLQEYNFLVIVRSILNNTENRNSILTTNGNGIKPVMVMNSSKIPSVMSCNGKLHLLDLFFIQKDEKVTLFKVHVIYSQGLLCSATFFKIYSLKNYDLS